MSIEITTTVVIPCYNDGDYIQTAIDSVNAQTINSLEIIIVDDASTDKKTLNVLKNLKQDNLTVIFLEKNGGPSVARNKAISLAKGKYILPLDADDKIEATYIKKAEKIFKDDLNMGIVYCKAAFFGKKSGQWELPEYSFPEILIGNIIFATALFKKSDWEKVCGYNENMRQGNEDYDFWLSILELKRNVYRIDETLFFYRIKESSRTSQLNKDDTKEIDTFEQIFHNHEKLYLDYIAIFFKELKKRQNMIIQRDYEIRMLYKQLERLHEIGEELRYAQDIVKLRDEQIQYLLPKNRAKNFIKRLNPLNQEEILNPFDSSKELVKNKRPKYRYRNKILSETIKSEIKNFEKKSLISIITPVYNVEPKWLEKAIESVKKQWYSNWELCIVDDCSTNVETKEYLKSINNPKIKIKFLDKNLNISGASNEALKLANGEYISLLDNDDELTPNALYEMVKEINSNSADFIYSDEDFIDTNGVCSNPHYKPDLSPDLLLSHNYITHLTCFKKELLDSAGWFKSEFDGAQDYELFLRLTEKAKKISHIPKVLYHWRTIEGSTSANSEAKPEAMKRAKRALEETLKRRGIDGWVEYGNINHYFRVRYAIKDNPLVSIIIPFKDKPELLDMCINSILQKSSYKNYEIIGVSNNSEDEATFEKIRELERKDPRVKFYEYNIEFNYAKINNYAVENFAKGEHILLLNNDIEVINRDWIETMLEHSQRDEIGCVGAKLYYPDDTIQHAGIIIGLGGYAGHPHKYYPKDNLGYFNRLNCIQNFSAVTAACLMIKVSKYKEVKGMDNINFKVSYNDVDFCLRVKEQGYLNIFTPYAELYHHESISRGYETTPEKIARFQKEKDALFERYKDILTNGDPYYNPNLCHDREDFSICPIE